MWLLCCYVFGSVGSVDWCETRYNQRWIITRTQIFFFCVCECQPAQSPWESLMPQSWKGGLFSHLGGAVWIWFWLWNSRSCLHFLWTWRKPSTWSVRGLVGSSAAVSSVGVVRSHLVLVELGSDLSFLENVSLLFADNVVMLASSQFTTRPKRSGIILIQAETETADGLVAHVREP